MEIFKAPKRIQSSFNGSARRLQWGRLWSKTLFQLLSSCKNITVCLCKQFPELNCFGNEVNVILSMRKISSLRASWKPASHFVPTYAFEILSKRIGISEKAQWYNVLEVVTPTMSIANENLQVWCRDFPILAARNLSIPLRNKGHPKELAKCLVSVYLGKYDYTRCTKPRGM